MGIGLVFVVFKLFKCYGLSVDDIDFWELNEVFVVQILYCCDKFGIDFEKFNVNGGVIFIGYFYGMSGVCLIGYILFEGQCWGVKYVVVIMCVGGGMGVVGLFEVF